MMNERGGLEVTYRIGDPLPGVLKVGQGTEIMITLIGTQAYAWTAVESQNPQVINISTDVDVDDRSVTTARAVAVGVGRSELRSTASFRGDRFGPRTLLWRLTVDVAPRDTVES